MRINFKIEELSNYCRFPKQKKNFLETGIDFEAFRNDKVIEEKLL
jgi:hypothetical protein